MIGGLFGAIVTSFRLFHTSCLFIGWAITSVLLGTVKGVAWALTNTALGVTILCEDFLVFLEDVGEAVEWSVGGLAEGFTTGFEGIWRFCCLIVQGFVSIPTAFRNAIVSFKLGTFFVNFVVLVKDAVLLLGICCWEIFAWIYSALVYLNEAPYILVLLLARAVENAMYNCVSSVETYWFRSVCGLALAYGTYLLTKNAGILPELHFQTIAYSAMKWCHYEAERAIRLILSGIALVFNALLSTVLATLTFVRKQTHNLKTFGRELFREFVSYTPTKAALQIKLEKEKASSQCVVCMDKRRDVMILNCRHLLMCKQCALTVAVNTGECPVCRSPIDNIISVYT